MDIILSDLRGRPGFGGAVADRIWRAWWKSAGTPLDHVTGRVAEALSPSGFPLVLVAHAGDRFLGTASLIASDLAARPDYTPWVAAVWVDPDARRCGIGSALLRAISDKAFALGFDRLHLCANHDKAGFYAGLGWTVTETGVGTKRSNIMTLDPVSAA